MSKMSHRLSEALEAVGARLKRDRKHRVYELPNGRTFVTSSTPSDVRAEQNALSDLRAAAGVEKVERRKAAPEVRAERRRRPGRAGEQGWGLPSESSPFASALRDTGLIEHQLRCRVGQLESEVSVRDAANAALRVQMSVLSAELGQRDGRISEMESSWPVRVWRLFGGGA